MQTYQWVQDKFKEITKTTCRPCWISWVKRNEYKEHFHQYVTTPKITLSKGWKYFIIQCLLSGNIKKAKQYNDTKK